MRRTARFLPVALVAAGLLLLATMPAGAAAQSVLTAAGASPSVAIDEFGAAHVVWSEERPLAEGAVTHYCHVPRGRSRCDVERRRRTGPPPTP
ncbi:MAG: hypothetical protein M0P31_15800 [Solirubrobacteraceae bacterium]|nr:hypothetical protein [Solirubrobacteraceae bacterium]